MIDATANSRASGAEKGPALMTTSPLSTTVESMADNTSRRWSMDNRSETPSRVSVTNHLFKYFRGRSGRGSASEETTLNELREELRMVRREFEDLVCQLEQAKQEINYREAQLGRYEETNEYCQRLLHRNSELELTIGRVQDEFEARIRDYEKLLEESNAAAVAARGAQAADEEANANLRKELEDYRQSFKALESQHSAATKQMTEINRELNALRDQVATATAEKSSLEQGHRLLREEYENFRNLYQRQLSEISSTGDSIKDVLRENMSLNLDKASLQTLHSELELKNTQLRQSLQQAREESRRLGEEAQSREAQLESIYTSYEKVKQSLIAITGIDEGVLGASGMPVESVVALRNQIDSLKTELDEKERRYQVRVNELEVSNMRMKEQLKNYDQVHQTAADLLKRNDELERTLTLRAGSGSLSELLKSERRKAEATSIELRKCQKEIKTLEAHILALNKRLNEQMNSGQSSPGSERVLHMLDKTFIESLKNDHSSEIRSLHDHYKAELVKVRKLEREAAALDTAHSLENQERSLRSKFIEEFSQRLKAHERATDEHYKELVGSLDRQNKNRVNELKRELAATKEKYEEMLRALGREYDEKMLSAANEMEEIMRSKDEEVGQLRSNLASSTTQNSVLDQEVKTLRRKLDELQQAYQTELREIRDKTSRAEFNAAANTPTGSSRTGLDALVQKLKDEFESEKVKLVQKIADAESMFKSKLSEATQLQRKCLELESQLELRMSEMKTIKDELQTADRASVSNKADAANLQRMIQRNKELEETIAILSSKMHDSIRQREQELSMHKSSQPRRQTLQVVEVESASSINLIQSLQHKITELELARSQLSTSLAQSSASQQPSGQQPGTEEGMQKLQEIYNQLLAKLELLSASVREGLDMDRRTREASAQLIEKQIDRMKMTKTIELLQAARDQRTATIEKLEGELRQARNESLKNAPSAAANDSYERLYKQILAERDHLNDTSKRLRQIVDDKNRALEDELALRTAQLRMLEDTKGTLSSLLGRNTELETELAKLFRTTPSTVNPKANFERVEQMVIALESHNSAVQEAHSLEVLRLQQTITEREVEYKRLETEQKAVEAELRDSEKLKLKLADQEWSAKLEAEKAETSHLRSLISSLEKNYETLRANSQNSLDEADTRFQELVKNISSQLCQNDLMIAEIQEQKNSEIDEIKNALDMSLEAQRLLSSEIDSVRRKLDERSEQYAKTEAELRDLMKELGAARPSVNGEEAVNTLRERFQVLVRELHKSQHDSERLRQYFDALIRRQENEISLAREHKNLLHPSLDSAEEMKLSTHLDTVEQALHVQAANAKRHAETIDKFQGEFGGLHDVQAGLARLESLSAQCQRDTRAAMDATENSGFAARALSSIVHRVQTLVSSIETRTSTTDTRVDVPSAGSSKRRLHAESSSPEEASKRPRV